MDQVVRSVRRLIEARICHVDLHPGNVLVDGDGRIYLIDFDKAFRFTGSDRELRDWYISRWRRAITKHGLPEVLGDALSTGLRTGV
jgi:3-deoxy-D-manno-octulosonic acid kinase